MHRRLFLSVMAAGLAASAFPGLAQAAKQNRRAPYRGAEMVYLDTYERPGTVIVDTHARALYHVMGDGEAMRYGVAVGKDGFSWAGIAQIGRKTEWPRWTPPASMIKRRPELAKFANGMPGGRPDNPLGARALYLFANGRDTLFRIHGTNEPQSIGTAASSGCIRMLNEEVTELYERVTIGTKVIVL
ncbi:MAG: L,D-transpeptidase [Parvibaculaceae bacterium]